MPIRLVCPSCSAALLVRDEFAGRAVKCPKCGGVIPAAQPVVPPVAPPAAVSPPPAPEPQQEKPEVEEPNEPAKPAQDGSKIVGRPVARAMKVDDEDDRPRRKRGEDQDRGSKSGGEDTGDRESKNRPSEKANRREDEEDDEERPTRSRKRRDEDDDRSAPGKKKGGGGVVIIAAVCGVLLLCCSGAGYAIYYLVYSVKKGAEEFVENLTPKNDKVTSANFQKLKLLMTRAEVEALLGPGKPTTSSEIQLVFAGQPPTNQMYLNVWQRKVDQGEVLIWRNREDCLLVAFHAKSAGRLQLKAFLPKSGAAEFSGMGDDEQFARMVQESPPNGKPIDAPVGQPNKPPADGVKEEVPPPGPLTEVTAEELAQAFKDNERAANTKYKDQWLLVEGKVLDVTSGPPDPLTKADTAMVKLVGVKLPRNRGDLAVWGYLRVDASGTGWRLTRGQMVKLKGKCTGGGLLQTYIGLKHCRIESFGPDPTLTATAAGIIVEFNQNAGDANTKYRDKEVTITNALLESVSGDLAIFTAPSKKGATIKLQVRFTGTPVKTLSELIPGKSRITFKARCGGLFGDKIANYDAYLVP